MRKFSVKLKLFDSRKTKSVTQIGTEGIVICDQTVFFLILLKSE